MREEVCDVDALGDEREEALERVDLVGVEARVKERRDGGVVVEVRVCAHPPHHRRAARLQQRPRLSLEAEATVFERRGASGSGARKADAARKGEAVVAGKPE